MNIRVICLACGLITLSMAQAASADIITALSGSPIATGDGYYAYTYNVQLASGQLDPVKNGTPVQFGTVYDFGKIVTTSGIVNNPANSGSVFISKTGYLADSSGNFTFSFSGNNTPAAGTAVYNNANLTDIRFTYVGSSGFNIVGQPTTLPGATSLNAGPDNLGTFTVYSPNNVINTNLYYDGATYKGSNNTAQSNTGILSGPTSAPEPSSWVLMILGFGVIGGTLRWQKLRARVPA